MRDEEVLPHVASSLIRKALDTDPVSGEGRELLDWCEIAAELCREKKAQRAESAEPGGVTDEDREGYRQPAPVCRVTSRKRLTSSGSGSAKTRL